MNRKKQEFLDSKAKFKTVATRLVNVNKNELIKMLSEGKDKNGSLKQYFAKLTAMFMQPLEQYFETLLPKSSIFFHKKPPKLKIFDENVFLKSISMMSNFYFYFLKICRKRNFWRKAKERS